MEFLRLPNLPEKKVGGVLVDYRIGEDSIKKLNELGIKVYFTCKVNKLYNSVCGHADMMITHLEKNLFICDPSVYNYYNNLLKNTGINLIKGKKSVQSTYPDDVAYNIAIIDKIAIHNFKFTDDNIICHLNNNKTKLINIGQGYTKCNTCIISNNALITEDSSVERALEDSGVDVLKISSGSVKLKEFPYGFLGGSTGLIDKNVLAVNGNIEKHSDCDKIIEFCDIHNVKVVSLTKNNIEDIGSIIPLYY